ncbi:predicted protein [Sparassis crispa]|uniref:Fungal-type protein kinase domain-containing protein n=1 Tax=Sparassis crispa TaxID=139825 RepID=A0A401H6G4_9APHY|nr:predicted protein [Sparassis crispa]GBE90035.1 predicted protein [Sparassis crispa]
MSNSRSHAPSPSTLPAEADLSLPPTPHSVTSDWTPLAGEENAEPENPRRSDDDNELHAEKAEGFILGPMPVADFLDFLPAKHTARRPSTEGAFNNVDEPDVASRLLAAIGDHDRCPGFEFKYNVLDSTSIKPALVCVPKDSIGSDNEAAAKYAGELFIDVQSSDQGDFFRDPKPFADRQRHKFVLTPQDAEKTNRVKALQAMGRNIRWATDALMHQHRVHYFSVSIHGLRARLMRWDMSGLIASESFSLREKPEVLCEFLWRFAHASTVERGYDPTVERASSSEECLFRRLVSCHVREQLDLKLVDIPEEEVKVEVREEYKEQCALLEKTVGQHYEAGRVAALTICAEDGSFKRCLVSRPIATNFSMRRGAMRGYWAVMDGRVVFLKDTWRQYVHEPEGRILKELEAHGVKNIPHVEHDGDVPKVMYCDGMLTRFSAMANFERTTRSKAGQQPSFQCTETDLYREAEWLCHGGARIVVHPRVHHRLVLKEVGFPLQTLRGTKELLEATHDAFQALIAAHDNARRIHRDISAGNVMFYRKPYEDHRTGYLIDWELSSKVQEDGQATDKYIVGTRIFLSQRLEARSQRRHMLQDDMEALLYVVAYCGLHWLQHPAHSKDMRQVVQAMFHNRREVHVGDVPEVTHTTFQTMEPGKGKLDIKENQTYIDLPNFNADLKDWLSHSMDLNHPRDPNEATQWDTPEPWNDYWKEFLERELPEDDRIRKQDSSSMRPKFAVKAISHRAGIHPNKRKAPQRRGPTDDGHANDAPGNGRPVKRLRRTAG